MALVCRRGGLGCSGKRGHATTTALSPIPPQKLPSTFTASTPPSSPVIAFNPNGTAFARSRRALSDQRPNPQPPVKDRLSALNTPHPLSDSLIQSSSLQDPEILSSLWIHISEGYEMTRWLWSEGRELARCVVRARRRVLDDQHTAGNGK